jgi:hypothetical protein
VQLNGAIGICVILFHMHEMLNGAVGLRLLPTTEGSSSWLCEH